MNYREITSDRLHELLELDGAKGKLFWKRRPASMFTACPHMTAQQKANAFNGRFAGKPAIDCPDGGGYLIGGILGCMVLAHRVIYCMLHGEWPVEIDHIDGDKYRNVAENIRDIGPTTLNKMNMSRRVDNASGVTGVSLDKRRGVWIVHAKGKHIGCFADFDKAVAARAVANENMGFHKNHGRNKNGR